MSRGRGLSEADLALWAAFVETIRPLRGRAPPLLRETPPVMPSPGPPAPAAPAPIIAEPLPRRPPPLSLLAIGVAPPGLDGATWERLRSGRLKPARVFDLHGLTLAEAHRVLLDAVAAARAEQWRCIEIITGRGSGAEGGAIRRELPHWLNLPTLRPLVLAAAHPHPANPGATRLLLRKSASPPRRAV